ncbi:hypothetical protein ACE38W_00525 [Chitinophaga sp. Hz27]|uniref:hypothetical protein n=1 Tax=Chitinophaga sp. Hz27 TaxID=3347169 RepID=UPI0035E1541B
MRITINDREVIIPSSLSEFSLGQRIAFQIEYGNSLDARLKEIFEIQDEIRRELELMEFNAEKMFSTFAFFAGCTVDSLKESDFVDDIFAIYQASLAALFHEEDSMEFHNSFVWNGANWYLHPPELHYGSKLSFGQLIDSKQVVADIAAFAGGNWEALQRICTIYLRKEGEEYDESFLYENSDRLNEMLDLPMNIALTVAFFLSSSINIYLNSSPSSPRLKLNPQENTQMPIMKTGVG